MICYEECKRNEISSEFGRYNAIPACVISLAKTGVMLHLSKQGADLCLVAGPGVEPGLGDYEPPVLPYTTPQVKNKESAAYGKVNFNTFGARCAN